jgi:hypothetical protein
VLLAWQRRRHKLIKVAISWAFGMCFHEVKSVTPIATKSLWTQRQLSGGKHSHFASKVANKHLPNPESLSIQISDLFNSNVEPGRSHYSLLRKTILQLLGGQQLLRAKRHRQQFLQRHDGGFALLVVHQYGCIQLEIVSIETPSFGGWALTSQNSLMNWRHIPHGLAGGLISVATARARTSPFFAPCPTVSMVSTMANTGNVVHEPVPQQWRGSPFQHMCPQGTPHSRRLLP